MGFFGHNKYICGRSGSKLLLRAQNMPQQPLILAVETSSRAGSIALALGENVLAETSVSGSTGELPQGQDVFTKGGPKHSSDIFPAIENLLSRFKQNVQEIEHVYISIGPGSFTGLRIATTLAKTMHLASGVKIVAVDTLDVIAANVPPPDGIQYRDNEIIAPVIDAKRNLFFVAMYQRSGVRDQGSAPNPEPRTPNHIGLNVWEKILPDSLMSASQFIERFSGCDKPIWLLGDGLLYYQDKFKAESQGQIRFLDRQFWSPRAGNVHKLGWQKALSGQFADPLTLIPNYLRPPEVTKPDETKKTLRSLKYEKRVL